MNLGDRHAFNAILVAAASEAVGTVLYSKSANGVSWQNGGEGNSFYPAETVTLGLVAGPLGLVSVGVAHLFVPSAKTVQSVHAGLVKAFETLPDLGSPPANK